MTLINFFRSFLPHSAPIRLAEKLLSGIAGGVAILLLGLATHYLSQQDYPLLLITPMASSAALLYAAPHSTFSQPWNLVGGHLVSALCGLICCWLIPDPVLAGGIAVGTAISLSYILKCLHPPAAATALLMILGSTQFHSLGNWQWTVWIVLVNVSMLLLLVLIINNTIPGRHYPMTFSATSHRPPEPITNIEAVDIEWALAQKDSVIDASTEDLTDIYIKAVAHAEKRRTSYDK